MDPCTVCSLESQIACECGEAFFCSEQCQQSSTGATHALFCIGAPASDEVTNSKMKELRTLMASPVTDSNMMERSEKIKRLFEEIFPVEEYPFKVMGFNRGTTGVIKLDKEDTVALAMLFPHQKLIRDSRGPHLPTGRRVKGAIYVAPTGAGKTATSHAVLANYSRELVPIKTPLDWYLNQERKSSGRITSKRSDYKHPILIYVTKTNLVGDARKDVYAQNSRSRALFEQMMLDNGVNFSREEDGKISVASFKPQVNIMSFKKYANMLLGKNKIGRNFWAGKELDDPDTMDPLELPAGLKFKGKTPVPIAYWKDENGNYVRGARSHDFMRSLIDKSYELSVRFVIPASAGAVSANSVKNTLADFLFREINAYRIFKTRSPGLPPLRHLEVKSSQSKSGSTARSPTVLTVTAHSLSWVPDFVVKVSDSEWEAFAASIQLRAEDLFRPMFGPGSTVNITAVYPVFESSEKRGWQMQLTNNGKRYRWVPAEGDYADFNPVSRLVVVFDEGHLPFAVDNLLKAEEAVDSPLLINSARESDGTFYFTSGTIDAVTAVRMGQALTPLSQRKGPRQLSLEEQRENDVFPTYEDDLESFLDQIEANQERLGAALAGKINVASVSGMRDLFPDKVAGDELNIYYEINNAHAAAIKGRLKGSVSTLMDTVNVPFEVKEHHKLYSSLFDPDRLLLDLFGPDTPTDFPLGRALLKALHSLDQGKAIEELAGRGITSSTVIENTITILAGVMQALGYEWRYLVPNKLTDAQRESRKKKIKNFQEVPLALKTVKFDDTALESKHAAEATIKVLKLEELAAVRTVIDGVPKAPKFVVLSNDLLVRREDSRPLESREDFAAEAITDSDFSLPFRLLSATELKASGVSKARLSEIAGSSKLVLHYYSATPEAQQKARAVAENSEGMAELLELSQGRPVFFVRRRIEGATRYAILRFEREDGSLLADPENFTRTDLLPLVEEYQKLRDEYKADARELIRKRFNSGLNEMRASNLRYVLISRQYGQGIDIFNCPEVFHAEPAPDRATDIQRDGRFIRPRSMAEHPYDQQKVRYHTLIANYAPDVEKENVVFPSSSPLGEVLQASFGSTEIASVLRSVNKEASEAVSNAEGPLDPSKPLLPYEAVKALSEDPRLTLRKSRLQKMFEGWAVDTVYNKIEREIGPNPKNKVYAPTNYVVPGEAVSSLLEKKLEFLRAQPPAESRAILERRYNRENGYDQVEDDKLEEFERRRTEWVLATQAPFIEREAQLAEFTASADIFRAKGIIPLNRRLAVNESDRQLSVSVGSKVLEIDPAEFGRNSGIHPLAQLTDLVLSGIARFDNRFVTTSIPNIEVKKKRKPAGEGSKAKKTKPSPQEVPASELVSLPSSFHWLPSIGSTAGQFINAEELHSFGPALDRIAPSDQEQTRIEQAVKPRFKALCSALGYWVESPPVDFPPGHWTRNASERLAASIYKKLAGRTTKGDALRLQSGVLSLFQYGVLSLDTALQWFASGYHSHSIDLLKGLKKSERGPFLDRVGSDLGKLFQLAAQESSSVDSEETEIQRMANYAQSMARIEELFKLGTSPAARSEFISILYRLSASFVSPIPLEEVCRFFEKTVRSFGLVYSTKNLERAFSALRSRLESSLPERFTLVDVFALFTTLQTPSFVPISATGYKNLPARLDELLEKMKAAGTWDITVEPPLPKEKRTVKKSGLRGYASGLSGGKYKEYKGKSKEELFDSLWILSADDWPIKKWSLKLSKRKGVDLLKARDFLRQLYLESQFFPDLRAAYLKAVSYDVGEAYPLLYFQKSKSRGTPVQWSASEQSYYWVSSNGSGKIESPVQLLLAGLTGSYPQLRVSSEASESQLTTAPLLEELPSVLREKYSSFHSSFQQNLSEPATVLQLLKSDPARVSALSTMLEGTLIEFHAFTMLVDSRIPVDILREFSVFAKRLESWSVAPSLFVVVDAQDRLVLSERPVFDIFEMLADGEATSESFEKVHTRVQAFTLLFNVQARTVHEKLYEVWRKNSDYELDRLFLKASRPIVKNLKSMFKKELRSLRKGDQGEEEESEDPMDLVEEEEESEPEKNPEPVIVLDSDSTEKSEEDESADVIEIGTDAPVITSIW